MKKIFKLTILIIFICIFLRLISLQCVSHGDEINNVLFFLNIPKINLYKELYKYDSNNNDVDKGLYLATSNSFLSGSIIIASHSGNSSISYFDNLDKLSFNDEIVIYKNGYVYTYIVIDKYFINKNGKFKYIDKNDYIYLITCDKNSHTKQLVIKGKIEKIVKNQHLFIKS